MTFKHSLLAGLAIMSTAICTAQDSTIYNTLPYDPHLHKLIPDKVYEFGFPLLFIFLLLNTIVVVLKNRADQQLKMKMIEKGISEEALFRLFSENSSIQKLLPLKYFLFCAAIGLSLIIIHFCKNFLVNESGYFAIGIILLFTSIAFFIYYRILQSKL